MRVNDLMKMKATAVTNILEKTITIDLTKAEFPDCICNRLDNMVNDALLEPEISKNDIEYNANIELDTVSNVLSLQLILGYSIDCEWIIKEQIVSVDDEDYEEIKEYFFRRLRELIEERIEEIRM